MAPGDRLEVRCTDPLAVIDIPHLVGLIGDRLEIIDRGERDTVFRIEKSAPSWNQSRRLVDQAGRAPPATSSVSGPYRRTSTCEHVFAKMNARLLKDDERNVNEAGDKIGEAVDCLPQERAHNFKNGEYASI